MLIAEFDAQAKSLLANVAHAVGCDKVDARRLVQRAALEAGITGATVKTLATRLGTAGYPVAQIQGLL